MPIVSSIASPVRADFDPDYPIPSHLIPAVNAMLDMGYTPEAIEHARLHLARYGTAENCAWIDESDRAIVESSLDRDPAWNSAEWDEHAYAITG